PPSSSITHQPPSEIYTLSLHDALPILMIAPVIFCVIVQGIAGMADIKKVGKVGIKTLIYFEAVSTLALLIGIVVAVAIHPGVGLDRKSTRLNSSHRTISYAVFCLKKKK